MLRCQRRRAAFGVKRTILTRLYFIGDRVRGIVCQGQPCRTSDGVTIGDSLSRVQRMYGPAFALAPPGTAYRRLIYARLRVATAPWSSSSISESSPRSALDVTKSSHPSLAPPNERLKLPARAD